MKGIFLFCFLVGLGATEAMALSPNSYEIAGEVTSESVLIQSRMASPTGEDWNVSFELSKTPTFENEPIETNSQKALPEFDFIAKEKISNLTPNTRYFYRAVWISNGARTPSEIHTFKTLPGALSNESVSFAAIACLNYDYFKRGRYWSDVLSPYLNPDKRLGYKALDAISALKPDFLAGLGDNVYYDPSFAIPAKTRRQMRKKWHEQFSQKRFVHLFSTTPAYWLMDDHDYRFDNAYPDAAGAPSHELGMSVFAEQLPVLMPNSKQIFYRTHQVNQTLQVWMLDNRTLRSDNHLPDGPEKSIWGKEQIGWLQRTLLESEAPFKIIFSSTPLIGPDKLPTQDNHASGFRYERDAFLKWLKENGFGEKNLYFVVGDSHWKYHSRHPLGFEEFSAGSLDISNALAGAKSGASTSTDPTGEVKQFYLDTNPIGGFLYVAVKPGVLEFSFYDSEGKQLYSAKKTA